MAEFTPNYNLKKPAEEDFYNINDHNDNMDIIDTALKAHDDALATKETPQGAQAKADAALNSAKQYTGQEVGEVAQELAAHKAETVMQAGGVHGLVVEQGTWTPTVHFSSPGNVPPSVNATAKYLRIGNKVTIWADIQFTDLGDAGETILISSPPYLFPVGIVSGSVFMDNLNLSTIGNPFSAYVESVPAITLRLIRLNTNGNLKDVNRGLLKVGSRIRFQFTYYLEN